MRMFTPLAIAAALAACLGLGSQARAEFVTGQIALGGVVDSLSPTDDVRDATSFTFSDLQSGGTLDTLVLTGGTGTLAAIPDGTLVTTSTLTVPTPPDTAGPFSFTLTLGTSTFVVDTLVSNTTGAVDNTRQLEFLGLIHPGGGTFDDTPGRLILNFSQAGGPGTFPISVSGTVAAVPEPSSLALVGLGALAALGLARRRRAAR